MWRCWLLIQRVKTLLIFHITAQSHRAWNPSYPVVCLPGCEENMRLFSEARAEEGVDDENLWGQQQVPASWLDLHVLMMRAGSCVAPHHWQKLSTVATSKPLIGFSLQCCVGTPPQRHWIKAALKLWGFTTWLLWIISTDALWVLALIASTVCGDLLL